MEFLIPVMPVIGSLTLILALLWLTLMLTKIFKIPNPIPYKKVTAAILVVFFVFGVYKVSTSPITRPTVTHTVNDTYKYKIDPSIVLEAPVVVDNSFRPEKTDTESLEYESVIKSHSK